MSAGLLVARARGVLAVGPVGSYYATTDWSGPAVSARSPSTLDTDELGAATHLLGATSFSARWVGYLTVDVPGTYEFTVTSDDGARLTVDGRAVVDNPGVHGMREVRGAIHLDRGRHAVDVRYVQHDGAYGLEAVVRPPSRREGPLAPALVASAWHAVGRQAALVIPLLWVGWLAAAVLAWPGLALWTRLDSTEGRAHALAVMATISVVALSSAFGIGWGLPGFQSWAPDEVLPVDVLTAIDARFSGGWHDLYPPVHYYVTTVFYAPMLAARSLGLLDLVHPDAYAALRVISRALSALMATVTVAVVYLTSREVGCSGRAALYGAIVAASMPVLVFHGRVANVDVPYVMWLALALWAYVAIIGGRWHRRVFAALGVAAALAVATKDQAYGYFVLPAFHLAWCAWRRSDARGLGARVGAVLIDPALWTGLVAFSATFAVAYNLVFNLTGFQSHVDLLLGPASQRYRMYDNSLAGHVAMAATALELLPWCLGWPAFLACVGGVLLLVLRRATLPLAGLSVPVVSYYAFVVSVVGYHYDRFFLGLCLSLAIASGYALAWVHGRYRHAGGFLARGVLAFSIVNGASVPVLMWADSRYYVERWLAERYPRGDYGAFIGRPEHLPRLTRYQVMEVEPNSDSLTSWGATFLVTNWAFSLRSHGDDARWQFYLDLEAGRLGYRRVLAHRTRIFTLLGLNHRISSAQANPFTNLNKINPEIRVYERINPPDAGIGLGAGAAQNLPTPVR